MNRRECLHCGRKDSGALFCGPFCSMSCLRIYRHLAAYGYRVRKGL